MAWSDFVEISRESGCGCPHAEAPNGCERKVLQCRHCGATARHQCGNNGFIGWHNCQRDEQSQGAA